MRALLSLLALLTASGCALLGRTTPARSDALACAESTLGGLGYAVLDRSNADRSGVGSLTAVREAGGGSLFRTVDEITVAVWGDDRGGREMRVRGERYEERRRERRAEGEGARGPLVPVASGGGIGAGVRVGGGGAGRSRIRSEVVAGDVDLVRRRCGRPEE